MTAHQRLREHRFLQWLPGLRAAALGVPRLCSVDVMHPTRSFVPQRESTSRQDRAQLRNHSNSCSPPHYPYFSFLTPNQVRHPPQILLKVVIGKLKKKNQVFFPFSVFYDIYSKTASTGSKAFVLWSPENICNTEGSGSSVSRRKMQSLWAITYPVQETKEINNNEISSKCCSPGRYTRPRQVLTFNSRF